MTIAGVQARRVITPRDQAEFAAAVRDCYAADTAFAFTGGGTELELGNAPTHLDTVIATTGLNRVIEYAPEDQTISVESGMTVAAVSKVLAEHDQFIALDVADPQRTTIGGAIATNAYGRRRLRFGSIKDNIVGIGIVRADGVAARGGGKVVKNVAGFDIPKLMVGSLGTLGAVVSATFRVHPIDHASAGVVVRALAIADIMLVCGEIVREALVPSSIVVYGAGERSDCVVAFDGFRRGVEEQVRSLTAIAAKLGFLSEVVTASGMASYEAIERRVRSDGAWRVRLGADPTVLATFLSSNGQSRGDRVYYPALGAALFAEDDLQAATIARWRSSLNGGTVVVTAMPQAVRAALDTWGEPPPSFPLMRRLKANFDPKNLCNPGRFVGGL